jgi:hypothetical protein
MKNLILGGNAAAPGGGAGYMKQEESAYAEQVRARLEKQLQRRAKELGFEVKKIEQVETAAAAQ